MLQLHFLESKFQTFKLRKTPTKWARLTSLILYELLSDGCTIYFFSTFRLKGVDSASNRYRWRWADDNDEDDDSDSDNDIAGGMTQPARDISRKQRAMAPWPASTTPSCTHRQRSGWFEQDKSILGSLCLMKYGLEERLCWERAFWEVGESLESWEKGLKIGYWRQLVSELIRMDGHCDSWSSWLSQQMDKKN